MEEASSLFGFEALSEMIGEFLTVGGHVLFGVILFGVGLFAANFVADTIAASGAPNPKLPGSLGRVSLLVLAGAIALRQMGLASEIIALAFGAVVGAIAVALAGAFGVGGGAISQRGNWRRGSASSKSRSRLEDGRWRGLAGGRCRSRPGRARYMETEVERRKSRRVPEMRCT
jgi:hypothetical protein